MNELSQKKHPYSGRVVQTADMMLQFYWAKLELPLEGESNIILESVIEEDNLHTTLNPTETHLISKVSKIAKAYLILNQ